MSKSRARSSAQNRPSGIAGNMAELIGRFGSEEACEEHMLALRWPGGFECPSCGCRERARVVGRREFRCVGCGWQFSATSGTMLAHTKLPLTSWFRAAWMVCSDPRGASAQAVARELGVSDATGAQVLRRLRAAMGYAMRLCEVGGGWVEVDAAEVDCGNDGSRASVAAAAGSTVAPVLVAASGSLACLRAVSDQTAGSVAEFCSAHVSRNHEVRCDAHRSMAAALSGGWDVVTRPSASDGDSEASLPVVHHLISNFKAKLAGTCHGVSCDRLQEHCDEFSWKYCHRRSDQLGELLAELVRWPHVRLADIRAVSERQPPHPTDRAAVKAASNHNRRVERAGMARLQARRAAEARQVAQVLTHL